MADLTGLTRTNYVHFKEANLKLLHVILTTAGGYNTYIDVDRRKCFVAQEADFHACLDYSDPDSVVVPFLQHFKDHMDIPDWMTAPAIRPGKPIIVDQARYRDMDDDERQQVRQGCFDWLAAKYCIDADGEFSMGELISILAEDGQVVVVVSACSEKERYASGYAQAFNTTNQETVDLHTSDIYKLASEAFDIPTQSISIAEY